MPTPNEFLAELVTDNGIVTGGRFQAIADSDLPRPSSPPLVPGQYAFATVTVDQWGRVTNVSAGAASPFTPADSGQVVYVDALGDLAGSPYFTFDDGTGTGVATIVFGGAGPPARSGQFFFYDTTTGFNVSLYCDSDELQLSRVFGSPAFVAPVVKVRSGTAGTDELQLTYASGRAVLTNPKASGKIDLVAKATVNVQESGGTAGTDELQLAYAAGAATINNPKNNGTITLSATSGGSAVINLTAAGIRISGGGTEMASISSTASDFNTYLRFPRGTPHSTPPDTGLKATASGVLRFTDGSNGGTSGGCKVYVGVPGTQANAAVGGTVFDHFADAGNVGGGEDDLYSDTTVAGQLLTNGDKLVAWYVLTFVSSATETRQVRAYFGGTMFFDSTALTFSSTGAATLRVEIVRESSSVVRCSAEFVASGLTLQPEAQYTRITGLTLSNTNILKVTGESAGATPANNDIVAKAGSVLYLPAA